MQCRHSQLYQPPQNLNPPINLHYFLDMSINRSIKNINQHEKQNLLLSDKDTNEDSDKELDTLSNNRSSKIKKQRSQKNIISNKKLKCELCKNFMKWGNCRYAEQCQFAHGVKDLKKYQSQNSNYKSRRCSYFFNNWYCFYGVRCNFQHGTPISQRRKGSVQMDHILSEYPQLIMVVRRRLSLFQKMSVRE